MNDLVNHPAHYTGHKSGVECIELAEQLPFCLGNAVKYIWRAGEKGDMRQDLEKALWYLLRHFEHGQKKAKFIKNTMPLNLYLPHESDKWRRNAINTICRGYPGLAFLEIERVLETLTNESKEDESNARV